mmetsp:Transcript_21804/g.33721  ORF Transcript_21804/g.33721 Transcript_21804/m.33721 type:complete len:91 (+) Transcript_21804:303-575(+)
MDEKIKQYLHDELNILCLIDHPYVVQYVESFEDEKYLYIVMEYCPGQELFKHIEETGKFTEKEAASIVYKVIEALNHIHAQGIVHRDLKP